MTALYPSTHERLANSAAPRPTVAIEATLITKAEAETLHNGIKQCCETIGRSLNILRRTHGWQHILDENGRHYQNWTDYLRRAFPQSRKHLYELMNAADVTERLHADLNTSQAYALSRIDPDLQQTVYEIASKRPGGATEDRIKAIGAVLTEARDTGYVSAGQEGEQIAFEAAIRYERKEIAMQKKAMQTLLNREPMTTDGNGRLLLSGLPAGAKVYVSVWIESEE